MANTLHLEHCLDSLEALPGELKRNFTLMHDLDQKNKNLLQEIDSASDEYLRKARELSTLQKSSEVEKIQKMFRKAKDNGDEKVNIAIQTYELVDKHIRRLDSDLAKFEAEMKEQGGRLSQTETEEESTSYTGSQKKKKLGRKPGKEDAKSGKKRKGTKEDEDTDKGKKKKGRGASSKDKEAGANPTAVSAVAMAVASGIPQEVLEMAIDPNEPTYCICQDVSWGEMIGCDNNDCPIEWFHFGCMGLTAKPKGKWYCPKCINLFKKKK